VRLARFTTGTGHDVFACRDGKWASLSTSPGYTNSSRLTDLVGGKRARELLTLIGPLLAQDVADVRLENAATIVDSDDDVWGAGLNYRRHSDDLGAEQPKSGPGSYLRPSACLIDNGQSIELPSQSGRVTAEAELGLVVGKRCKNVPHREWRSVIVGVTAVLDMTAEDAVRQNPRYIPWAKGFDTFCSVGPQLVTLDEFAEPSLDSVRVSTILNGEVIASAPVSDMRYDLSYLVEYFTAGRTLSPGTVICTGTPGAAVISSGDLVQAVVEGIGTLTHMVR
jgi:2-keto-4-pentenoate hydratase/2-oxohepta-3-ene-1,7-dioic acid hydratase in catechol pathway